VTLMNGTTPGEPPHADIGMLAQFMLDAAREDASLVMRAHGGGRDVPVYRHAIPASREEPHLIDSHIRSLQADHLTDVLTSDQHTVKPWLSARLDVSPPVLELKDAGFPLVGGRQDYVDGHPTAVVVYRNAKHVINLFAWASPGQDEAFRDESQQGFNVVTWRHDGMAYYAVSDVEADRLAQFAELVAQG
jgi:anti-sigma factor RsiW